MMKSPLRWSLLCLLVVLTACGAKPDNNIVLPQTDSRDVRYLRLDNDLQVVLISDPSIDKAAAALDINVGSRHDPRDRQGLAHFLEHMLFLGTEKYPDAGEYQSFISSHGGSHNAYTSFEHTNYFFDIGAAHLDEALDRFAQFFSAPLFNAEFVGREVNAVNSEYQARIQNDYRRALDVFKELANSDHPFTKFTVGNLSTLLGGRGEEALRQDLLDFYEDHYSANRMGLVVIGRENLDELQAMVVDRFSEIENRKLSDSEIKVPLVEETPLRFELKPRREMRELSVSFELPDVRAQYHKKPLNYLGHLLGHEGEGSLLYVLKKNGWAEGLRAGAGFQYHGGSVFNISIELTPAGMAAVDTVTDMVFEAIALIQSEGVAQWRFQELTDIARLQFDFRTRPSEIHEVSQLANNLHYFSPSDLIRGDYAMTDFDPDLIQDLVNAMTPDKAIIAITRPELEGEKTSELYNVSYKVTPPTAAELERWKVRAGVAGLALPKPNPFIASDLSIKSGEGSEVPRQVVSTGRIGVWHMLDKRFSLPKGNLNVLIRSPSASSDATRQAAAELWVRMVRDELNAFAYSAQLAGLDYSLQARWDGIGLELRGFNDKQGMLLDSLASRLANPEWDEVRFLRVKMDYIRDLENQRHADPYRYLSSALSQQLQRFRFTTEQRLQAVQSLGMKEVKAYSREVMSATQLYLMAHGNYSESDARQFARVAADFLLGDRVPDAQPEQVRRIPEGNFGESYSLEHNDSALLWYLQAPNPGHRARIVMGIAGQMIGPAFFNELRTRDQLGYVVYGGAYPVREVPALYFVVQSPVTDTADLQKRFRAFLDNWQESGIDEQTYERNRKALRVKLLEQPRNLWEAGDQFWRDLMDGYTSFNSREQLVDVLDQMGFDTWKRELLAILEEDSRRSLWLQAGGARGEKNLGVQKLDGPGQVGRKRQFFLYEHPPLKH
ncbi:secreted Zn-dependent insulinase-like peptidase [Litorivivens lipolytica]|uniref:Protease 3 n=1 Tax=Litorivivens lipolytica TaxID=1524264 RepID=A0A7W4W2P0_9GAMM|nr:insulinase family protein [Litorivivens lipolytica]MBB3045807.1 secreted Zn-dependent insulinase-like peptidase [Litorivivens lipolytica]